MVTRITGKNGLVFKLATVDYSDNVSTISLTNEDADSEMVDTLSL